MEAAAIEVEMHKSHLMPHVKQRLLLPSLHPMQCLVSRSSRYESKAEVEVEGEITIFGRPEYHWITCGSSFPQLLTAILIQKWSSAERLTPAQCSLVFC